MNTPGNLKYTKTDEWVLLEGKTATIGVTDYAQEQLSDVVFVEITVERGRHGQETISHCHHRIRKSRS